MFTHTSWFVVDGMQARGEGVVGAEVLDTEAGAPEAGGKQEAGAGGFVTSMVRALSGLARQSPVRQGASHLTRSHLTRFHDCAWREGPPVLVPALSCVRATLRSGACVFV